MAADVAQLVQKARQPEQHELHTMLVSYALARRLCYETGVAWRYDDNPAFTAAADAGDLLMSS